MEKKQYCAPAVSVLAAALMSNMLAGSDSFSGGLGKPGDPNGGAAKGNFDDWDDADDADEMPTRCR